MMRSVETILSHFRSFQETLQDPFVDTVYIGGGTPSVLDNSCLSLLLGGIRRLIRTEPAEWTVEGNPESADAVFLSTLEKNGIHRLSLGIQSFLPQARRLLGRPEPEEGLETRLSAVRKAWSGDLNLDIICGLPGQTVEEAVADVRRVMEYGPEHISLYTLSIEEGTPLHQAVYEGRYPHPDPESSEEMWFAATSLLESAGYEHYEVSAFAEPGKRCHHNQAYWHIRPYSGSGPSAVSTLPAVSGPVRLTMLPDGNVRREDIGPQDFLLEYLLMSLRTSEGVPYEELYHIFGADCLETLIPVIDSWKNRGLIEDDPAFLRMNPPGLALLDTFLRDIMEPIENAHIEKISWPILKKMQ